MIAPIAERVEQIKTRAVRKLTRFLKLSSKRPGSIRCSRTNGWDHHLEFLTGRKFEFSADWDIGGTQEAEMRVTGSSSAVADHGKSKTII
jgi:hypothetical protein